MFDFKSNKDEVKKKIAENKGKALEAIGIFIEGETKIRCPVLTGNLRGSYTHKVDLKNNKVSVGSGIEYAPYVEKGTSRSRKQPHLTPAAEENLDRIKSIAKENMAL